MFYRFSQNAKDFKNVLNYTFLTQIYYMNFLEKILIIYSQVYYMNLFEGQGNLKTSKYFDFSV